MAIVRISSFQSSPATSFWLEADHVQTDVVNGRWLIHLYLRAANGPGGSSGSGYFGPGDMVGYIDGNEFGRHAGNPFLPSGYGDNQTRWYEGPWAVWINGRSARNVPLALTLAYGNVFQHLTGFIPLPTIANVPPAPNNLRADQVTPTSMRVRFSSTGTGGSAITGWQVQRATNSAFTTGVVTVASDGTTTLTGLTPASRYYFRARGRNAVGWGAWSSIGSGVTASGAYASINGVWVPVPINYSNGSSWTPLAPLASDGTTWEQAL